MEELLKQLKRHPKITGVSLCEGPQTTFFPGKRRQITFRVKKKLTNEQIIAVLSSRRLPIDQKHDLSTGKLEFEVVPHDAQWKAHIFGAHIDPKKTRIRIQIDENADVESLAIRASKGLRPITATHRKDILNFINALLR